MFRWLCRRGGKRITAEVGEPPENRGAEPPDQIAEPLLKQTSPPAPSTIARFILQGARKRMRTHPPGWRGSRQAVRVSDEEALSLDTPALVEFRDEAKAREAPAQRPGGGVEQRSGGGTRPAKADAQGVRGVELDIEGR